MTEGERYVVRAQVGDTISTCIARGIVGAKRSCNDLVRQLGDGARGTVRKIGGDSFYQVRNDGGQLKATERRLAGATE